MREPGRISPFSLAWDLLEKGHTEEGIRYVSDHRDLLKNHLRFPRLAVLVGNAHLAQGQAADAVARYREAIALDSSYVEAQNNLAWILSTHADAGLRDGEEAVRLAEAASRTTGGADPSVWSTLSTAYAEVGQFEKALAAARQALALARRSGQTELGEKIERRLKLFESQQPYRSE